MASTVPAVAYDSDAISEQAPPGEPACSGYAYELPDQPLISICPSRTWVALNLRDLWAYRELLFFLTWRRPGPLQADGPGSRLGDHPAAGHDADLHPLLRQAGRHALGGYPVSPLRLRRPAALDVFLERRDQQRQQPGGQLQPDHQGLFPAHGHPRAAVGAGLVDFAIAFALLAGLMAYYHVAVTWSILMLPVLVVLDNIARPGRGDVDVGPERKVSRYPLRPAVPDPALDVRLADHLPGLVVPERWRWVLALNPLTGIIEGFRSALFGRAFDWTPCRWRPP